MINYEKWVAAWALEHPNKVPPTKEQFERVCDLFELTSDELGIEDGA